MKEKRRDNKQRNVNKVYMPKATLLFLTILSVLKLSASDPLPGERDTIPAVTYTYFPARQYAFVFRNWTLVPEKRLAEVLGTSVENTRGLAFSMGLPPQGRIEPEWLTSKGYITVLRRNWNLLNYDQLLQLLGISRNELAWRLKEDDFLYVKLGRFKPYCDPLVYTSPTAVMTEKAAQIAEWIQTIKNLAFAQEKPRFSFSDDFPMVISKGHMKKPAIAAPGSEGFEIRMVSSYCAEFGDPLMDKHLGSFPEGLLYQLSKVGVNALWLHTVLNTLVLPDGDFPGSEDAPKRIEGLKNLVNRAARFGIKIFLYMNEPRGMEHGFFKSTPSRIAFEGVKDSENSAMCTSVPGVRQWLTNSLEKVFKNVPGLGGIFTITGSENLTSCFSHRGQKKCERCKDRSYSDMMIELITAMEKGVKSGNPDAEVFVWDWGWDDHYAETIIKGIPKSCWLMSVSEWSLPIVRGNIRSVVGEYSLSSVGPGPRALDHWRTAREAGLKTMAKVQVNSTWEMAAVPAIPVLDLVARHARNLSEQSVNGVMLSWSLGGYPSPNIDLFRSFRGDNMEETLTDLADKYYGKKAAPVVRSAWTEFSRGFEEFPFHISTVYSGPQNVGPANPFFIKPTGKRATMVGFPYDDLNSWRAVYPEDCWAEQMTKVADGFQKGCRTLEDGLKTLGKKDKLKIERELNRAKTVQIHCASASNQARFITARNRFLKTDDKKEKSNLLGTMSAITLDELNLVKEMIPVLKRDASIAFESSNHYFYIPQDLLEKYINLQDVLLWLAKLENEM